MTRTFLEALDERVLVCDGAMGTMLQAADPSMDDFEGLEGCNEILNVTRPDIVAGVHAAYLEVGVDCIETNTFGSTSIAQSDFGLESIVYELNVEAAALARKAADEWTAKTPACPRYVAGAIGPTNRTLSISPDVNNPAFRATTFAQVRQSYREQVRGLLDGGVDLLLLDLEVGLDVVVEDTDLEVDAFLGERRLDRFQDLRMRHGGRGDGQRLAVVGLGATAGGEREQRERGEQNAAVHANS